MFLFDYLCDLQYLRDTKTEKIAIKNLTLLQMCPIIVKLKKYQLINKIPIS